MKWFIAEVVDPASDPQQSGSVKIRIQGHQDDIPDDKLRNAKPVFDVTNPISGKKGGPVTGVLKGSQVCGFFLDEECQIPVFFGTIGSEGKRDGPGGKLDATKGDTPVAIKDKQNSQGEEQGGGDKRWIAGEGDKRLDSDGGSLDTKPIRKYAEEEAESPFGNRDTHADDSRVSFSIGQTNPGA